MSTNRTARGLVDTPLLLAIIDADADAYAFAVAMLPVRAVEMSRSSVLTARAELPDPRRVAELRRFARVNVVHSLTARIADHAYRLLDRLPPPSPLTADDALVAATALAHKLPLYTLDPGRFAAVPGLAAVRPY